MLESGHHDMGGQIEEMRAGRIERAGHDYAEWERRIDAMAVLLWGIKGGKKLMSVDEHRKNIESLPPQEYDGTSYYEKWIYALTQTLIHHLHPQQLLLLLDNGEHVLGAVRALVAALLPACPAVQVTRCPAGQEPVIDYSSDCCAHFTCQPLCSSAH